MSRPSKESARLIRRMTKAILAEPKFYLQSIFPGERDCGAECCAAGWAVWLDVGEKEYREIVRTDAAWPKLAKKALKLPQGTNLNSLFYLADGWPKEFSRRYYTAANAQGRAQACHDRWEYFIETGL